MGNNWKNRILQYLMFWTIIEHNMPHTMPVLMHDQDPESNPDLLHHLTYLLTEESVVVVLTVINLERIFSILTTTPHLLSTKS